MDRNPASYQARPGQPLHSTPPVSISVQPTKWPTRPNLPEPSSVPKPAQWPLPLPEHGATWPWPPLPVLAGPPCAVHRRPTAANCVRRSSRIVVAPSLYLCQLGLIPCSVKTSGRRNKTEAESMKSNLNESPIRLEIRFGTKSRNRTTSFPFKYRPRRPLIRLFPIATTAPNTSCLPRRCEASHAPLPKREASPECPGATLPPS
jgi:hypothetical protein